MKIGYIRVSTAEQNTARQEVLLKEQGVQKVYIEKVSGKDTKRQRLLEMLDYARDGDTVIVESYSRLARSAKDLLNIIDELKNKGVEFISLKENIDTSNPQGKLILTIFAGLAEFEREMILQRQREGIEIAKRQGKYKGRPPKELENWEQIYNHCNNKEISISKASKLLGVSRSTFYRKMKKYEEGQYIDIS